MFHDVRGTGPQAVDAKSDTNLPSRPPPHPAETGCTAADALPPQRFRVLFHSLFRVLFDVPSRYD